VCVLRYVRYICVILYKLGEGWFELRMKKVLILKSVCITDSTYKL
jgi:hypothetical protein